MAKRGLGYDGTPAGAGSLPLNANSAGAPKNPRQGVAMPAAERAGRDPGEVEPVIRDVRTTCNTQHLKRRFDQLFADRSPVNAIWDQISKYFFPLGSGMLPFTQVNEGAVPWNTWDVWDSTAIDGAQKLSSTIHGSVTSPSIRWFKLAWRDADLAKDVQSGQWLDGVGERVFSTLQDSDFNLEIGAADKDLVGFGNTVVFEEAADEMEWRGVDFEAVPIREWFYEPDSRGGIYRGYRLLNWSAVQVMDLCDRKGWTCPEKILNKATEGQNLNERIEVVFAVFPRPAAEAEIQRTHQRNRDRAAKRKALHARANRKQEIPVEDVPSPDEPTYPLLPHMRPWGCVYFLRENGERIGEESGYYELPACMTQWDKTTGSVWGHGPCHILLPTVKYLNAWMETEHQAAAKAVDPPMAAKQRGLISSLDLSPGGLTLAQDKDSLWPLLPHAMNFDIGERKLQELRVMVQRGLHNDELVLKDSPAMTATEVQARYELMQRVLGPVLGRLEYGLLGPIVKITIGHLLRAKQLEAMPPLVLQKYQAGSLQFDIEYQGPLARAQRTDEVAAIERVISFAAALLKMGLPVEVVMATLDVTQAIREVAKRLGTPAGLLKDEEEVKKALEAWQDSQARAQAAMAAKTEGEAAANHASAQASLVQAMAASRQQPGAGGAVQSVPASPAPVVTPPFGVPAAA